MKKLLIFLCIISVVILQFSCKKNDTSGGPPLITQVRSIDTLKRDSFFVKAIPGNLIVIQGNNLGGLKAVYFNDTSAYFNPAYATNTNIIVTIPASAQTIATNPKVPSILKLVTDHGTVSYSFTLYLPPPSISSLSFDNSGTLLYINGYNFQGLSKITFPIPGADTALSFTVNKTFTQAVAVIPPGVAFTDSVRIFTTYGSSAYSYPPPMGLTSLSNDNGGAGAVITITGSNLIGIQKVIFPGGINGTNITPINVTSFQVTVPAGITTSDYLKVVGALGTTASPQLFDTYLTRPLGYLSTFTNQNAKDNTGFVGWTAGYADAPTSATNYPGATDGTGVLINLSPMGGNSAANNQGNTGLLQLNASPWVTDNTQAIDNYAMKFEIYVAKPWSAGEIWISVGGWYQWKNYTARYAPWETASGGIFAPGGWVTATIPLKQFITLNEFYQTKWNPAGVPANTFNDFPYTAVAFLMTNDQAKPDIKANAISLAIDNVRIVKVQ